MSKIFQRIVKYSLLVAAVFFGLQVLMGIVDFIFALFEGLMDLGVKDFDGLLTAAVFAETFTEMLAAAVIAALIWLLIYGLAHFATGGVPGGGFRPTMSQARKMGTKAAFKNMGKLKDTFRGMFTKQGLRSMADASRRGNLLSGGRRGGRLAKAVDGMDMLKSLQETGKKGRLSKEDEKAKKNNLANLAQRGLTAKDTREGADNLAKAKNEKALNDLGIDSGLLKNMSKHDRAAVLDIASSTKSQSEKQNSIQEIMRQHYARNMVEGEDGDALKMAQDRQRAALAHGQTLGNHIANAEKMLDGTKVYGDDGSEIDAATYVKQRDASAIGTAEKFRASHHEMMSAYVEGGVPGARTMDYALNISRTNEEQKDATLNGSSTPGYQQPIASSEERRQEQAAAVHGGIPIDREAAEKSAEKARVDANNVAESSTGMRSTGEAPIAADNIPRNAEGWAISTAERDGNEVMQSANAMTVGSLSGTVLPESVTTQPVNSIDDWAVEEAYNDRQYVSGTNNSNVFADEPLNSGVVNDVSRAVNLDEFANDSGQGTAASNVQYMTSSNSFDDGVRSVPVTAASIGGSDFNYSSINMDRAEDFNRNYGGQFNSISHDMESIVNDKIRQLQDHFAANTMTRSEAEEIQRGFVHRMAESISTGNMDRMQNFDPVNPSDFVRSPEFTGAYNALVDPQRGMNMMETLNNIYHATPRYDDYRPGSVRVPASSTDNTSVPSAGDVLGDVDNSLRDEEVLRETERRRAEKEEEERKNKGTEGMRDKGRGGRMRRE